MEFRLFADLYRDVSAKNKVFLGTNVVLAVLLAVAVINNTYLSHKTKTIIVPTHLAASFEVAGERASAEYIRIMCLHLTGLLYTYTPYSIADQYREFLAYIPAERLSGVKEQLQGRIDQTAKLKISESFLAREVLLPEDGVCVVSGKIVRWSVGQQLATDDLFIRYKYTIHNGVLSVEELTLLSAREFNVYKRPHK